MQFLDILQWGTARKELERTFSGQFHSHPVQNAIGVEADLYGYPAAAVYYFRSGLLGNKLVRGVLALTGRVFSDGEAETVYGHARADLTAKLGTPTHVLPHDKNDPLEFRQSEMLVWVTPQSVITLACKLGRDDFSREAIGVAIGCGDRKNDPISKMWS